jgi:4-amino-4-deoxychorismate lyase
MTGRVLVNGVEHDAVSVDDRGLHYGDGLFETIAVRNGTPRHWQRHWSRLQRGAQRLTIPVPPEIEHESHRVCAGVDRAVLKIILTRGNGGRGYAVNDNTFPTRIVRLLSWRDRPADWPRDGVALRLCRTKLAHNPLLAGIKHLNRLEQVLARAEWRDDFAEGLMCGAEGEIIEGTMSNVFLVRHGALVTPDLALCGVEGVMRSLVLDAARRLGHAVQVRRVTQDDLAQAEEVFLTNSLIGIWPVRSLDRQSEERGAVMYTVGNITRELQTAIAND